MASSKRPVRPITDGSLAFDLDALVRERRLDEAGIMPEQQEIVHPRPQRKLRTAPQVRTRPSPLLLGGIALLCSMVMVMLFGYVQLTKVSANVSHIKNEIAELTDEHISLLTAYEKTFDLATIKQMAEESGMSKPSAGQIEYIDISGADCAIVYHSNENRFATTVRSTVSASVRLIQEYFR